MRNVIYATNFTLDGCFDHTKMIADEELLEHYTLLLRDADLLVYGRKTYQLMVPYWPDIAKSHSETKAENEFADTFDSLNTIVFSHSLDSAEGNTRIVRTNLSLHYSQKWNAEEFFVTARCVVDEGRIWLDRETDSKVLSELYDRILTHRETPRARG